jgi:hypothetical protein
MLSIGLIGEINLLDQYIKRIRQNSKVHIAGKSSVGTKILMDDLRLSIPEFNRIELIERCDILLINHFSLLSFNLIKNAIKKSKHIFVADYPDINDEECEELIKLSEEAKTIFQVQNPLFYKTPVRWIGNNIKAPAFWDVSFFTEMYKEEDQLMNILLMLNSITGASPRKIEAVSFQSSTAQSKFINLRLDYGNTRVVNLNFGKQQSGEFIIRAYSPGKTANLDFINQNYTCNNSPVDLAPYHSCNEFDTFIENIITKKHPETGIDIYFSSLKTFMRVKTKLSQFLTD